MKLPTMGLGSGAQAAGVVTSLIAEISGSEGKFINVSKLVHYADCKAAIK